MLIRKIVGRLWKAFEPLAWRGLNLHFRLSSGIDVCVRDASDWFVYNEIFVNGDYDKAISEAVDASRSKPLRVLDLGANVGFFALRLFHQLQLLGETGAGCECICVEGNPRTAEELVHRLRTAGLVSRVRTVCGLVGAKAGIGTISDSDFSGNNTTAESEAGPRINVPFVDLTEVTTGWDEISLLKCDLEGSEELLVENYRDLLDKTRIVIMEVHPTYCDTARVLDALHQCGFEPPVTVSEQEETSLLLFVKSRLRETFR